MQSALAAVACTTTLSVVAPTTPAVAKEPDPSAIIGELTSKLDGGSASIGDVASALAGVEDEIARIEGEIGQYREAVNQALVDLQDARSESIQAKNGTRTAQAELDQAQKDLDAAKEKLDDLSRTAYRRANTSEAVTNASGQDAREDMLERRSYLREQAEDQKKTVDSLERVRTEKANKESQLRKAEELADKRVDRATEAESAARDRLSDSQSHIESSLKKRDELVDKQEAAQTAIDGARDKDKSGSGEKSGSDDKHGDKSEKKSETHQSTDQSAATQSSQDGDKSASASTSDKSEDKSSEAKPDDAKSDDAKTDAAGKADEKGAKKEGITEEQKKQLLDAAFQAAADIVADSQPDHAAFEETAYEDGATIPAIQYDGAASQQAANQQGANQQTGEQNSQQATSNGQSATSNQSAQSAQSVQSAQSAQSAQSGTADGTSDSQQQAQGITNTATGADEDLVNDLDGVLEDLDTSTTSTDKAGEKISDKSREDKIEAVIDRAMAQVGMPYAWGGGNANGPTKGISDGGVADSHGDYNKVGFDCSGLVIYAFAAAGISLPHFTGYQYQRGEKVDPSQMQRGDLIFYGPNGGEHVAIYLGDGQMLEAPQSGSTVSVNPVRQAGMAPYAVRLI